MSKKTYTALTPINHNGTDYGIGEKIDLDEKTEAAQLLAVNAVSLDEDGDEAAANQKSAPKGKK